jgi:quercetin dioxygenase-like cupin family protein
VSKRSQLPHRTSDPCDHRPECLLFYLSAATRARVRRLAYGAVKRWDLTSLSPSSEKLRLREPGPDAPRVTSSGDHMPRVLFSAPECRAVVLDLETGETMGDHQVRERAVVQVVRGRVLIESGGEAVRCDEGALVIFEPNERHAVHALANTRLLLILAPWPGAKHYGETEAGRAQLLPANAFLDPIPSTDTVASPRLAKPPVSP